MKIRNYKSNDYQEVISLLKESELYDEVCDSEDNLSTSILVAENESKVVGCVLIIPYGKKVSYLFRLAVKKDFRRQGIATDLIKEAEEMIAKDGTKELGFYVDSGNIDLQEFYKKRGFKISPKAYYYMWKEL